MRYYKTVSDNYIIAVGTGFGGIEITESEYLQIMTAIKSKPAAESGYYFRLCDDLVWEQCELQTQADADPELTAEEALDIILGGAE